MRFHPLLATLCLALLPATARAEWIPFDPSGPADPRPPSLHVIESSPDALRVRVDFPGVSSETVSVEGRDLVRWTLPGGSVENVPGRPARPYFARLFASGGASASVEVESVDEVAVAGVALAPAPAQPKRCGGGSPFLACDARAYGAAGLAPSTWASIDSRGSFAGVPVARLVLHPVRYDPVRSEARVARSITVKVTLDSAPSSLDGLTASFRSVLRRAVVNPGVLALAAPALPTAPERLLVLAHDSLLDAVQPLVDWKRASGMTVQVVAMSKVGTTAADVAKRIQEGFSSKAKPSYVLLVGDAAQVPHLQGSDGCASDWMYTQLDGDDLYSDVVISRISAATPAEVAVQVARSITYEKTPPAAADGGFLAKAMFISSSEGDGDSNDDVRSDIMADLFIEDGWTSADRYYHSNGLDTADNITAGTQEGRGWICFLGHGSGTDWSTTTPPYSNDHIAALVNPFRNPIIMDVSCLNGGFDGYGDCLAEAWMKAGTPDAPDGAVAIYSSSTETAWDQPAEMAIGVSEALLSTDLHRWGEALLYGRAYLIEKMGANEEVELVFQQYVQFGDGTLLMRTRPPHALDVTLPGVVPVGKVDVPVEVRAAGVPVAHALVALSKGSEVKTAAYTSTSGTVTFSVNVATPGELSVLVTSFDADPFEAAIPVAVTGCGVVQARPEVLACGGQADVTLWDSDLDADPAVAETVSIDVVSSTGGTTPIVLTETAVDSGAFAGTIDLGALGAVHGTSLVATYDDAACEGAPAQVSASVKADCQGPVVTGVELADVKASSVTVKFATDEPATSLVKIGTAAPPADGTHAGLLATAHSLTIKGLSPSTAYVVSIEATDAYGNVTVADNGGKFFGFATPACSPDCTGKQCGDDGCGGSCGTCPSDQTCESGKCSGGPGCETKPTPGWQGAACEACVCDLDWLCCTYNWDEYCVSECKEDCGGCGACQPACSGKQCGADGCGGVCGSCGPNAKCDAAGQCIVTCVPACDGKACGDDGCGGKCGTCLVGQMCAANGQCACQPACDGKACGDDGCGGSCGACAEGTTCGANGQCACAPACDGRECGADGCGGSCGECPDSQSCSADGKCVCEPSCGDRECGDDGCGGSCGTCAEGATCGADRKCTAGTPDADEDAVEPGDATPVPEGKTGGGGCSGSSVPSGAGAWLILALAAAALRIRSRRSLRA